jgi:hypothetical protein
MNTNVLSLVYKIAMHGDLKACKLYLEATGAVTKQKIGTFIDKQQNNNYNSGDSTNPNVIKVEIIQPNLPE